MVHNDCSPKRPDGVRIRSKGFKYKFGPTSVDINMIYCDLIYPWHSFHVKQFKTLRTK